ncbi:MAG TPA: hypothetical protein HPP66_11745 [Planctomycetes bacterium]|nr:hypothetical protein [Planctomycetota bacterium]
MNKIREDSSEAALKIKNEYRNRVDLLRSRLCMLSGEYKLLMTMYWENGISLRQISRLTGISRVRITRRIHKLTARLMDGKYITCLRNRSRFTKREMDIAKDYFLLGISMREIAEKQEWSYYQVRKTLLKIQRLLEPVISESTASKLDDYKN